MFRRGKPCSPVQLTSVYRLRYVPLIKHKKCTISIGKTDSKSYSRRKKKGIGFFCAFTFTWGEFEGLDEIVKERVGFGHGGLRHPKWAHERKREENFGAKEWEMRIWEVKKMNKCLATERSFFSHEWMNEPEKFLSAENWKW